MGNNRSTSCKATIAAKRAQEIRKNGKRRSQHGLFGTISALLFWRDLLQLDRPGGLGCELIETRITAHDVPGGIKL